VTPFLATLEAIGYALIPVGILCGLAQLYNRWPRWKRLLREQVKRHEVNHG